MINNDLEIKTIEFKLFTIKENYSKGKFKIPLYQRGYIWDDEKRANLIDSLIKGYPIGTIVVWYDGNIGYILDGQQRTRSLLIIAEYPFKYLTVDTFIDITNETLLETNEENVKRIIKQLSSLSIEKLYNNQYDSNYKRNRIWEILKEKETNFKLSNVNLEKLADKLNGYVAEFWHGKNYSIPAIEIINASEEDAIEIFSRINTSGIQLSKFEILAARWSIYKFEILDNDFITNIKNLYGSHNEFSGLSEEVRETSKNSPGELIYSLLLSTISQTTIYKRIFCKPSSGNGNDFLNQKHLDKLLWFIRTILYVEELKKPDYKNKKGATKFLDFDEEQDLEIGQKIYDLVKKNDQSNLDIIRDLLYESMIEVENNIPLLFMKKSIKNQESDYIFGGNYANLLISLASQIYIEKSMNNDYKVNPNIQYHFLLEIFKRSYSSSTMQTVKTTIKDSSYINEKADLEIIKKRINDIEEDQRNNSRINKGFSDTIQMIIAIAFAELRTNKPIEYHYDHVIPRNWLNKRKLSIGMNSMGNCGQLDAPANYEKSDNFDIETMLSDQLLIISDEFKVKKEEYKSLLIALEAEKDKKSAEDILNKIYLLRWKPISKMFLENIDIEPKTET